MKYFCRIHPGKKHTEPGKCPECGRYLVIVEDAKPATSQSNLLIPEGLDPAKFRKLPAPVQTMLKRMSSSRKRSAFSLKGYSETAVRFFDTIGGVRAPTEQDWHDYFMVRRRQGISDRTMALEFYRLAKLASTNHYKWPFEKEDVPHSVEDPYAPTFTVQQVEQLIKAWPLYSTNERFYLAVSTVWGHRSTELIAIKKRDFDVKTILIHRLKREKAVRHLIPDELKPLFLGAKPSISTAHAASVMFARICDKAKVKRQRRQSFHSIRHSLTSVISWALAEHKLEPSLLGEWMGWSKARTGQTFGGSPMVGTYRDNSIGSNDPFWLDKAILPIHPFLKLWEGVGPQEKPE